MSGLPVEKRRSQLENHWMEKSGCSGSAGRTAVPREKVEVECFWLQVHLFDGESCFEFPGQWFERRKHSNTSFHCF
jgi:hypothetical protein